MDDADALFQLIRRLTSRSAAQVTWTAYIERLTVDDKLKCMTLWQRYFPFAYLWLFFSVF